MGLYGDILRAADGSIFTFDRIISFDSNWITFTEEQIDAEISNQAAIDDIFLGRFVFLEEKLWVYVKTYDNKNNKYSYTKVAKLHSLNELKEDNTDEWINITDINENEPYIYHEVAAPDLKTIVEKTDETTNEIVKEIKNVGYENNYLNYKEIGGISIESKGLNYTYYDQKGHAFLSEAIIENKKDNETYYNGDTSYTLILNGGGFLGKYLT